MGESWTAVWVGLAGAAFWGVCRENLRLRATLARAEYDAKDAVAARIAEESWRDTTIRLAAEYVEVSSVLTEQRDEAKLTADDAADTIAHLYRVLGRLWKDRRVRQHNDGAARTEGYLIGVGDAARVMERNADRRLDDANSLAMCDELARYDLGDPGA